MSEEPKKEIKGKKKGLLKIILWFFVVLFLLIATCLVLIRIPAVQTRLTQYFAEIISERTGFSTTVDEVSIEWFDTMALWGIQVRDQKDSLLMEVEEVDLKFSRQILRNPRNIVLGEALLRGPKLYTVALPGEIVTIAQWVEAIKALSKEPTSEKTREAFQLRVEQIRLVDGEFGFRNYNRDSVPGFNYNHFILKEISATIPDFSVHQDTLRITLQGFHAKDQGTGLEVKESDLQFQFSPTFLKFSDMTLRVGESVIRDSIIFQFDNPTDMSDWVEKVDMTLALRNSILSTQDLAHFAPIFAPYRDKITISGQFQGTVNRFDFKQFVFAFGSTSLLNGDLSMTGAPSWEETFITLDLSAAQIAATDLRQYVPEKAYPKLQEVGRVRCNAQFFGFIHDFVANGSFRSSIGNLNTDINLKLDEETNSTYSGRLALEDFALGRLFDIKQLGKVSMDGTVEGQGFTRNSANLHLNANISKVGLLDYIYTNIITDADLAAETFEGSVAIEDPNLQFAMEGTIDIREKNPRVNAIGVLDTCFLANLGWLEQESFIRTEFELNAKGLSLDSITGYGGFKDLYLEYQGRSHLVDSLTLYSRRFEKERSLQLLSDRLEIEAVGEFDLSPVIQDAKRLVYEYQLNFSNNKDSIDAYYAELDQNAPSPYSFDYSVSAFNVNPFINLFFPELYVAEGTEFSGSFRGGDTYILNLLGEPDSLAFGEYSLGKSLIDINTSKSFNNSNVLSSTILESETITFPGFATSQKFFFESIWFNQTIDFRGGIEQASSQSLAELEGQIQLLPEETQISLIRSDLMALDKAWHLSEGSMIHISRKEISVDHLQISQGHQRIAVNGTLSDSLQKFLTVEIDSFRLENLNPLLKEPITGELSGRAKISNPFKNLLVETNLGVDGLHISDFLVGNLEIASKFDSENRRLDVNSDLFRDGQRAIYLYGAYFPEDNRRLDMVATFNQANLSVAEPFFDATFSNIQGYADGTFRIKGTTDYPLLEGTGTVEGGHLKVNYLNTEYDFSGEIAFTENEIGFRNLTVHDENNQLATLDGGIFHDGFRDFVFNLYGDFSRFQVLKTTAQINDYYYGTGVLTGNVEFLGSVQNLIISGKAKTERGTRFYIPIDNSTTAEQAEFIRFVNLSDTSQNTAIGLDAAKALDLSDINLDFDLDVTPDAYVELIFDIKSGDIIRGRGRGDIELDIDSEGTFNMFGDLVIESGGYNFTLYNLINKEFEVISGSTISWVGDPYKAQMNLSAKYTQLASIQPLVVGYGLADTAQTNSARELSRKYPAQALLYLQGDLLSPNIDFGVDVEDFPSTINVTSTDAPFTIDVESAIIAFKEAIRADEQELKRQVFSLIILKRFSEPQSFDIGATDALGSSVSELLSNQLSYWITQVDENLEIDVDINNLSPEALNTFQLRLSYSFLDGRLRVTRDGNILNEDENGKVGSDILTLIGDFTVEYLLTPDGKFRVKMYSRNANNGPGNLGSFFGNYTTTGVSLMHTQSFNNIRELFDWAKRKGDREKPTDDQPAPDEPNTPQNEEGTSPKETRVPPPQPKFT